MGRRDGTRVKGVPNYRKMMPFFMRTRAESAIYFEEDVRIEKALEMAERMTSEYGTKVTVFHLLLHAVVKTIVAFPRSNRFVSGRRIYQRNKIWLSFSVKKEYKSSAPITVVKREFMPTFTLKETIETSKLEIRKARKEGTHSDREADLFLKLPRFLLSSGYKIFQWLLYYNMIPYSFIEKDPFYATMFIANLGSFNAKSIYHHLYEYGDIPTFAVMGIIEDKVLVEEGEMVVRKVLPLKITYDERGEDGFYMHRAISYFKDQLENPEKLLKPAAFVE